MEGNISLVLEDICVQEQTPDGISYEEIIQHIEEQIQHELNKNNDVNELLAREMHYALNHTHAYFGS
jgi:hypothetical protein